MGIDINQLHKAFNDPSEFGQTTLVFDTIVQTLRLYPDKEVFILAVDDKHKINLLRSFSYFMLDFYDINSSAVDGGVRLEGEVKGFVKPVIKSYADKYLRGKRDYFLYEDNYR